MEQRNGTLAAGILGFLGVALGAFGAHALKTHFSDAALGWWQTAVEYHLIHAAALLALGWLPRSARSRAATWAFTLGVALFSGSLYVMAVTGITALGVITPIGGVSFLVGWGFLIGAGLAKKRPKP